MPASAGMTTMYFTYGFGKDSHVNFVLLILSVLKVLEMAQFRKKLLFLGRTIEKFP
jgi:hypothetical protein